MNPQKPASLPVGGTRHNGAVPTPSRFEVAFPELYAPLTDLQRASVDAALASDRLERGLATRELVELVILSATEQLDDEEYLALVLEHAVTTPREE